MTEDQLAFRPERHEKKTCTLDGRTIAYRSYEGIPYCTHPLDPIQSMNIFVPEAYFQGQSIGKYRRENAPIFLPNTVGGYLPGPADAPGRDAHGGRINSIFLALEHGYVVASIGVRGRTSGKATEEFFVGSKAGSLGEATGRMVGRAPAFLVDYKAGIRYLRHNRALLPGDTERMVTNGTSAGGALSALAGATGNSPDYAPYLAAIGAAEERDDIFAASCYCPITDLEHADAAYEWQFAGQYRYYRTKHRRTAQGIVRVPDEGEMDAGQIALSQELKMLFPAYVNALSLRDGAGEPLTLDAWGEGSFKEYIKKLLGESAEQERLTHAIAHSCAALCKEGSEPAAQPYLSWQGERLAGFDWAGYIAHITRMKAAPAFDSLELKSPENEEFGDERTAARHFTAFSRQRSRITQAELADDAIIKQMNPTRYLGESSATAAPYWRIRHGSFDRDTSLAVPAILALLLRQHGAAVDLAFPWGLPHSGDYDLPELFAWVDGLPDGRAR